MVWFFCEDSESAVRADLKDSGAHTVVALLSESECPHQKSL